MKKIETYRRFKIAESARNALTARGFETRPGWCQRWVKQVLLSAGISSEMAVEGAPSARAAFERYERLGLAMPKGTMAQIGDILYKVNPNDGKYGHVGIYVGNLEVAENSSAHWNGERPDARGKRGLRSYPSYRVVRLWEMPT